MNTDGLESRKLELKGRSDPIDVWVSRLAPDSVPA
jgi:hypothetical protein